MQSAVQPILIGNFEGLPYVVIFITAFLAGYLIPAPEEVVFVLLGYAAVFRDVNIFLVIIISIIGVLASDSLAFYLGFKGSALVDLFKHKISQKQLEKYKKLVQQHAGKTIFTSRFIPTLRVLVPILAGTAKIRWKKFILYDSLAAILNIGALILVGFIFENRISLVLSEVQTTRHILSLLSLVIIGTIISLLIRAIFFKKNGNRQ